MRLNQFIARTSGLSRRAADKAIGQGRVTINGQTAGLGLSVKSDDVVHLDERVLSLPKTITIMLNKPAGYVTSRAGQGSKTIYELLPKEFHNLKPVGRLDKDSSGLLLLTNDGELANQLTHPRYAKEKVYEIELDKSLLSDDKNKITAGVELDDGLSRLSLSGKNNKWKVIMREGRKRQIRRTFDASGYKVIKLHRQSIGPYSLKNLSSGDWQKV